MRYVALADAALGALAVRVWRARGGFVPPLRIIAVAHADAASLRIVEIGEMVRTVGAWSITEYADVPDAIRLLERQDRYLSGLVFHDRVGPEGCYWELVHPVTLAPSHMFSREWRESYGES